MKDIHHQQISKEHFYNISLIRMIATTSIFACHIFQYYDVFLAWWFNAGVDVFLILSGYLYGIRTYSFCSVKERFDFCLNFYFKVFVKLLVPYYLLLALMITVYLVMERIDFNQIIRLCLFKNSGVSGFGHVWYFKVIIICYIMTPFWYFIPERKWKPLLPLCLLLLLMPFSDGNLIWYCCYLLGIILSRIRKNCVWNSVFSVAVVCLGVALSVFCICTGVERTAMTLPLNLQKLFLGAGLVILCIGVKNTGVFALPRKILDISDWLSYEFFLVHPFFLSGALCIMRLFEKPWQNIITCIITVLMWSATLHFSAEKIRLCISHIKN